MPGVGSAPRRRQEARRSAGPSAGLPSSCELLVGSHLAQQALHLHRSGADGDLATAEGPCGLPSLRQSLERFEHRRVQR